MKKCYKTVVAILFVALSGSLQAQNGYIKFTADSIVHGFIRFHIDIHSGEQLIEFWRTKNQDKGERLHKAEIEEYAIGKDRYVILKNFQPIANEDYYFNVIEAKVVEAGTIELMRVTNPDAKGSFVNTPGAPAPVMMPRSRTSIDVIKFPKRNEVYGVPLERADFTKFMHDVFSAPAIAAFEKDEGKLTPAKLRKFVTFYNEKTAQKNPEK